MKQRGRYSISAAIVATLLWGAMGMQAQELRCTVNVNADKVEGSNKQMFQTLQQSISDFVNNTKWTTLVFTETERIECTMMLIINSVSTEGLVDATFQLQSKRPVYNTNYSTPILNIKDDNFAFQYQEFDRLDYQPPQFTSNLSAMIVYYCYLVIGYDLDSYSRLGGTICFQTCEDIVNTARSASSLTNEESAGWKAQGNNKNRHTLVNNLMDEAFKAYRNYFYEYHRLGLDVMSSNVANGRGVIAGGMPILKEAYRARPAAYVVGAFLDAKNDELTNIFQKGTDTEKKNVLEILGDIDPTRLNTVYERISQ